MATFMIPGDIITSVSAAGGGAPETGYYKATISGVAAGQKNAFSRKLNVTFDTGFSTGYFLNTPYNEVGQLYPGINESKARGMVAYTKSVFVSAGFTNEQMAGGVSDDWLTGTTVFVEWHNAKDLGGQYGDITRFITETSFTQLKNSGTKPAVKAAASTPARGLAAPAAPAAAPVAPSQVLTATAAPNPMGNNGVGGITMPPAPITSPAQTIVS